MDHSRFYFFISGEKDQILPGSDLFELPLSGEDTGFSPDIPCEVPAVKTIVTVGDYFLAARQFLVKNDFKQLKSGFEIVYQSSVQTGQISRISLFLEKHGAFYHPLRVQVVVSDGRECVFVLNGTASKQGLSLIKGEYQLIAGLNKVFLKRYLPRVSGSDFIKTDKGKFGFFLGEWFEGYKEFHVCIQDGKEKTVVWNSNGDQHYIPETDALKIYQEVSRILTYYYDMETFDQIFPWHHAAGDFIVKQEQGNVFVRLISVRGYSSLTQFGPGKEVPKIYIVPSLLFFFLNIILRIRIDRIEGTGKIIMLGEQVIPAAIKGFLNGLDEKSAHYDYGDLRAVFLEFYRQFNLQQITELMQNITALYPQDLSDTALIQEHLNAHCRTLHSIVINI